MVLAGGYSPSPSNDVWVSTDGQTWLYTGQAPWAPRGWVRFFSSILHFSSS